jgi:hypothetical protein
MHFRHVGYRFNGLKKIHFFIIKMASESHSETIQQLTCFVMKSRIKSISFTSDIVLMGFSRVFYSCLHRKIT